MEVTCSSKTSVDFQQTAWCYIPEDRTLHNHHCENPKPCIMSKKLIYVAFLFHILTSCVLLTDVLYQALYSSPNFSLSLRSL
jgi:hypothetical protein